MPRLIITPAARAGLERCRKFLSSKNEIAARRAATAIGRHLSLLENSPEIGRPYVGNPRLQEIVIPFGETGYVALFIHDRAADAIVILAFRHQKEAGY